MKQKRIFLTGGCGYIGSVLTKALLKEGHQVLVWDAQWFGNFLAPHPQLKVECRDLRNLDGLDLQGFDTVIHLASVANDPSVELNPRLSWEVNCLATMQLADLAQRSGVGHFLFASSGSVYGVKEELQVTEDLTLFPISEYNKTKMVGERIILSYAPHMTVQCIRPGTVCGLSPRMRLDVVVNMLAMQALTKGCITILGGDQIRPNIHMEDMVGVYLHFLKLEDQNPGKYKGIYNASFENLSVRDIAQQVIENIPADLASRESNDPRSYRMNSDKLLATGFIPQGSVTKAIQQIAACYHQGSLKDHDQAYNVRWMKAQGISETHYQQA